MRISELARHAEVPVATVKYYLREGLLHDGVLTSATQAQYDQTHVSRLRLVRALLGPGGLTVTVTRRVLSQLDDPPSSTHDLLGQAQAAVTPPAPPDADLAEVHRLMRRWGWRPEEKDGDSQAMLAAALTAAADADFLLPPAVLDRYAEAMLSAAEAEIAGVPTDSPEEMVRYVVLGTVLVEPLLLALRRLAEQEASARRFVDPAEPDRTTVPG